MAVNLNDDLEFIDDDYFDMFEFGDEGFEVNRLRREGDGTGNDVEDASKHKNDTTALEYRNGKDMQGIPWERLNYTRDKYREMRLKQYKNYQNLSRPHHGLEKECKQVKSRSRFYDFQSNTRLVKSTIVHFQAVKAGWMCFLEQLAL